jgi:hypothetical protein
VISKVIDESLPVLLWEAFLIKESGILVNMKNINNKILVRTKADMMD